MKCNEFKDNLNAYIENDISDDIRIEMANHMCECEECNKLYEEEMEINNLFKKTFEIDGIQFKSSRNEIMQKIDKNKYKKTSKENIEEKTESKVIFPRFKNAYKFIGTAAALLLILVITPNLKTDLNKADMEANVSGKYGDEAKENIGEQKITPFMDDSELDKEQESYDSVDKRSGITNKKEDGQVNAITMDSADKEENQKSEPKSNVEKTSDKSTSTDNKIKSSFVMQKSSNSNETENIIWKKSTDGRYALALNMAMTNTRSSSQILLKDTKNDKVINLDNINNISSLIKIESLDEDNLLVIVSSTPLEKEGGDLYKLNIKNEEMELIVKCKDNEKIVAVNKKDKGIEIKMIRDNNTLSKNNELIGEIEDISSEEINIKFYDKQNNLVEERKIDK